MFYLTRLTFQSVLLDSYFFKHNNGKKCIWKYYLLHLLHKTVFHTQSVFISFFLLLQILTEFYSCQLMRGKKSAWRFFDFTCLNKYKNVRSQLHSGTWDHSGSRKRKKKGKRKTKFTVQVLTGPLRLVKTHIYKPCRGGIVPHFPFPFWATQKRGTLAGITADT